MSRRYQHTKELLPVIKEMLSQGKSHKEIEAKLGLVGDRPVHNLLKRERKKEKELPKQRGRKAAKTVVRRKKYRNYGEYLHRYPNLLNRDFNAARPQSEMGNRYFVYKDRTRHTLSFHYSRPI